MAETKSRKSCDPSLLFPDTQASRKSLLKHVDDVLLAIEHRLIEIDVILRDKQTKTHGALTMRFNKCGKNCSGCPHVTWVKWVDPSKSYRRARSKWHGAIVDNPLRHARNKTSLPVKEFIEEAVELIDKRTRLIANISTMGKIVNSLELED